MNTPIHAMTVNALNRKNLGNIQAIYSLSLIDRRGGRYA
jgi:hypothetical protein